MTVEFMRVCGAIDHSSLRFVRIYLRHHATPLKLKAEHRIIPEITTYTAHFATVTQGAIP
ncbi:MAG: hypothetical protein WCB99_06485 [Candidatus Cybelea sp.]